MTSSDSHLSHNLAPLCSISLAPITFVPLFFTQTIGNIGKMHDLHGMFVILWILSQIHGIYLSDAVELISM